MPSSTVPEKPHQGQPDPQASTYGEPAFAIPSCGDFEMRIAADGTWFHQGSPIGRIELVKLFSTVLRREEDGRHWLVTPVERGEILVDDAAFVAKEVWEEAGVIYFKTNIDKVYPLGNDHPIRVEIDDETQEPRPYISLNKGLEARVLRSVFYHLVDMAELKDIKGVESLVVTSNSRDFVLGKV
ncbi:MAG: DUF1285 domain-containing protein [Alphaproteobacteria bacterium]